MRKERGFGMVCLVPNLDGEEGFGSGKGVKGERLIRRQGSGESGEKDEWVGVVVGGIIS